MIVAVMVIAGPGVVSKVTAIKKPSTADSKPMVAAMKTTVLSLSERSRAVAAGVVVESRARVRHQNCLALTLTLCQDLRFLS